MKSIIQVLIAIVILIIVLKMAEPVEKPIVPEGGHSILEEKQEQEQKQEVEKQKPEIPHTTFPHLLELHNSVRKSALTVDRDLTNFAQNWAKHMEKKQTLKHSELDFPGQWEYKGENIAEGYQTEEDVFDGWMKSKGHRKNIKNEEFTHIGIGKSGNYWCVCFGRQHVETVYWWEFWK